MSSGSFYDTREGRFFPGLVRCKQYAFFRNYLADRYTLQTYWEKTHWYTIVPGEKWGAMRKRLYRAGLRYKTLPLPGDEKIVIAREGELPLPVEFKARKKLMDEWLAMGPVGTASKKEPRTGGTKGFGGPYKNSRGKNSKDAGRYIRLQQDTDTIEEILKLTEVEYMVDREDIHLLRMTPEEGKEYVETYLST